jgi:hypothetical protein
MHVEMVPGPLVGAKGGVVAGGDETDPRLRRLLSPPLASSIGRTVTRGRRGPGDRGGRVRMKMSSTSRRAVVSAVPMTATTVGSLGMEGAH